MKRTLLAIAVVAACNKSGPDVTVLTAPHANGTVSADPAITTDAQSGDLLMTWVAGDTTNYHVYFARSSDEGKTWSVPVRVTQVDNDVKPHGQASPRIVAANNTIAVFWPNNISVAGRRFPASQLRFARSTDGGKTWSATTTLNDDTTSSLAGHTFHGAVFVPPSTIAVAWLDSRASAGAHTDDHSGDATIYMATSNDMGGTWSLENKKLWGGACPCCRVSLAARNDGEIVAAWRGHLNNNVRDPVVGVVNDNPAPPTRVHADGWEFAGCPHTGPALQIDGRDRVHIAWFTGKTGENGIFYSESNAGQMKFEAPVPVLSAKALPTAHPTIATNKERVFVAYDVDPAGKHVLSIAKVTTNRSLSTTVEGSEGADHPQIVALRGRGALVAWTQKKGSGSEIRIGIAK